ncbi:MAG: hypothetical protein ACN4G0_05165 [Polyangiales bacterium]
MASLRSISCFVLLLAASVSIGGCTADSTSAEPGSLSVNLQLRGEIQIDEVSWEITRPGMSPMSGTINTSAPGSTPSVEVFGLPPGTGYLIKMEAMSAMGETSCGGSAEFEVESGTSTSVMVLLNCKPPESLGGVRVNGKINICADLLVMVVAPLETSVGSDIELFAVAEDAEGDAIEYLWEGAGGSFDDPTAAETLYTCEDVGSHDVSVVVSDDGFDQCMSGWTVRVTCVEGDAPECDFDQDCGPGEICFNQVCIPDVECNFDEDCGSGEICVDQECILDVECNFDLDCLDGFVCVDNVCVVDVECNVDADCDAGEVCVANECVPGVECNVDSDCDADEVCVGNVCVPDVECNVDQDCNTGEICVANVCVPSVDCSFDQDCNPGEICVGNVCVPDVECNVDQDCNVGEVCQGNECVPDVECNVDADCADFNECTIEMCNLGANVCDYTEVQNGTPCDNGTGTCVAGGCRTNDLLGTDFVIVFEANYVSSQLGLFLSGPQATAGVVSIPSAGFTIPFTVTPGKVTKVALPPTSEITTNDVVELGAAIRVTATEEITVYGLNRLTLSTDAFAALPTEALGQRHRIAAWSGAINGPSQFAIAGVPAFDGDTTTVTTVTITPTAAAGTRQAGVPYQIQLKPFDAYQLQSDGDLTGSLVQSDGPIAVYGGNRCANIPTQETGFCDHVVEQLPPVDTWGTEALTVPLATRASGDTFRILADQNGTQVQLDGASPESFTLNAGQFAERSLEGAYRITANAPILVAQFSNGTQWDGVTSDPFMMLIPPAAQFIKSYTFATPGTGFPENFANIVALTSDVVAGNVLLDGVGLPAGAFTPLPGTGFSGAQVPIEIGTHTLLAPNPVGLYVYGYAGWDSYGYPGGFSARNDP